MHIDDHRTNAARDAGSPEVAGASHAPDGPLVTSPPSPPCWLTAPAVGLVVARLALPIVAIPLIPVLVSDRILLLVLLRPQKEFLLIGGAVSRVSGEPNLLALAAAFLPVMLIAVWAFFIVARAYHATLVAEEGRSWLRRAIPPRHLAVARRVLVRRGPWVVVLGRLAAFPPTVLAAAAGLSDMRARRYLAADLAGAALSFVVVVGAGWVLGDAFARGGIWVAAAGVSVLVVLLVLLTRWIRREAALPGTTS